MKNLGVKEAVLTAKHGCGFYLWPTNVTLPDGSPYGYNVSPSLDVIRLFVDTMKSAGLGAGFYYSLTNNFYLNVFGHYVRNSTLLPNQKRVTQEEFEKIALASVEELWSNYGELNEIWFDGGYTSDMQSAITDLLDRLQPNALALNGGGISKNPARWSGTEGDQPPGWPTIYSTACCDTCSGPGCPPNATGAFFYPSSTDYTLQAGDVWFFEPGAPLRTLAEMQMTYHWTVGANTVMELDFAIDRTGNVAPAHAELYERFGAWIRSCYGHPVASASVPQGAHSFVLPLGAAPVLMDRVMLREDQSVAGQCVAGYTVEVAAAGSWAPFHSGVTIGNKRIALGTAVNATALRLNITGQFCSPTVSIAVFSPEGCEPARTKVQFVYSNGLCLTSNSTFPCASGAHNSCPLFLGNCSDPMSIWDDSQDQLSSYGAGDQSNVVNIDCNSCKPHAVAKLIVGLGSAANLRFVNGQLAYICGEASGLCLNGGQGPATPTCGGEHYLATQVQVDDCASSGTQGWRRVEV